MTSRRLERLPLTKLVNYLVKKSNDGRNILKYIDNSLTHLRNIHLSTIDKTMYLVFKNKRNICSQRSCLKISIFRSHVHVLPEATHHGRHKNCTWSLLLPAVIWSICFSHHLLFNCRLSVTHPDGFLMTKKLIRWSDPWTQGPVVLFSERRDWGCWPRGVC